MQTHATELLVLSVAAATTGTVTSALAGWRLGVRSARWPASPCLAGPEIAVGDLDVTASVDAAMEAVTSVILVSPAVPAQELGVPAPSRR